MNKGKSIYKNTHFLCEVSKLQIIHYCYVCYWYHHSSYCVLCFGRSSITEVKRLNYNLLNQNFQYSEVYFFFKSVLLNAVWFLLSTCKVYVFLFVANFPMTAVKIFCLCGQTSLTFFKFFLSLMLLKLFYCYGNQGTFWYSIPEYIYLVFLPHIRV
jgi:hypothetical protein